MIPRRNQLTVDDIHIFATTVPLFTGTAHTGTTKTLSAVISKNIYEKDVLQFLSYEVAYLQAERVMPFKSIYDAMDFYNSL